MYIVALREGRGLEGAFRAEKEWEEDYWVNIRLCC